MICLRCGHPSRPGNRFCTYCGAQLSDRRGASARLIVMSSPGAGCEYALSSSEFYIGRSTTNDLVVDDEQVSWQHAKLFSQAGVFWVEDLQSTNGTYVNGRRIARNVSLKEEDLIRIGPMILKFRLPKPPMDEEQVDRA